jgi:G3E family GTPase
MPNRSDIFIFVYNFSMLLGPVAQTFFINPEIQSKYKLDGVITVVDAAHIMLRLGEKKADGATNEALQQVSFF